MRTILKLLTVSCLVACHAGFAAAATGKSYAVFIASYNPKTHDARGGVAGTAFFVSHKQAITAYHVLQPGSWAANPGELRQIWLVHEGEPAIELKPSNLRYEGERDLSYIDLGPSQTVSKRYIFTIDENSKPTSGVATEGFQANTAGPMFAFDSGRLAITAVPELKRLSAEGSLVQEVRVSLRANDVHLEGTACFQLSYQPVVGMSGGPVISADGKVIGVNSFADPRTRSQTWAVKL